MKQLSVWIIALSFAFAAGFFVNTLYEKKAVSNVQPLNETAALTNGEKTKNSTYIGSDEQVVSSEGMPNNTPTVSTPLSLAELSAEFDLYASNKLAGLTFSETARLYLLVADLSEDKIQALVRQYSIDSLEDSNQAFSILFSKYVEMAPNAALELVLTDMNESVQPAYISIALTAIAQQDPIAAYEHFLQHSDNKAGVTNRNQAILTGSLLSIFENLAKQDRALAIDKLKEVGQLGYPVITSIIGLTRSFESKADFVNLLTEIESIDNHEIEDSVIGQWTRHNPEQVGTWLTEDYEGNRFNEIKEQFIRSWSYIDKNKSADWMVNNTSPEKLNKSVVNFMQSWAYDNPQEAMQWFSQQSAAVYNQSSFSDFLRSAAYSNPQFAANYLSFINDEKRRSSVSQSIYQGFKRKSSSKAEAFLEQSPFRNEVIKFDERMNNR